MVLQELLENVLKYHPWKEERPLPMFLLSVPSHKKFIVLQTSNSIEVGGEHHQAVLDSMHRLRRAATPVEAGVERMMEKRMNPQDEHSRLGFYQIAGAGLCQLNAQVDENCILYISAKMQVNDM